MTLTPSKVRGRGSQSRSGPHPMGPSSSEPVFRVVPLATRYVSFCCFFEFWWSSLFGVWLTHDFCQRPEDAGVEQEVWRPTLQCVAMSKGGNRAAAAKPSLPGVVPPGVAIDNVTVAAMLLAAIPVPMAKVALEVTLAAPPPPVMVEETRGVSSLPRWVEGYTTYPCRWSRRRWREAWPGWSWDTRWRPMRARWWRSRLTMRRIPWQNRRCHRRSWQGSDRRLGPPAVHRRVT